MDLDLDVDLDLDRDPELDPDLDPDPDPDQDPDLDVDDMLTGTSARPTGAGRTTGRTPQNDRYAEGRPKGSPEKRKTREDTK